MSVSNRSVVESLVKPALVVAAGLAVVQFVLGLPGSFAGGAFGFARFVLYQVIGVIGDGALIAAVLALVVLGTGAEVVKWGAIGLYVAGFVQALLFDVVALNFGLSILVDPLYAVVFFLSFVAAVRIYRGESVLPGVDVTIDLDRVTLSRDERATDPAPGDTNPKPR